MPRPPPPDAAVYVISVAAELSGLHPQTLRTYERMGLITPGRTGGGGRRYSGRDIDLLREIASLTSAGIGIEGVRRILELEHRAAALAARNQELGAELEATRRYRLEPGHAGLYDVGAIHAIAFGRDARFVRVTGADLEQVPRLRFDLEARRAEEMASATMQRAQA